MLKALRIARRGRRAANRTPSNNGTGKRVENAIVRPLRRGERAASASARTVLSRDARTAGTRVATIATATATAATNSMVDAVSEGVPALPISPAPGLVRSG